MSAMEQPLDYSHSLWWAIRNSGCENRILAPESWGAYQRTPSRITALLWQRGLCNSMKLWAMLCRATQEGWVMVESSDKTWSTGERNGKPLQSSCFQNPMNSMKSQRDRTQKDELPRSVGAQYATREEWRNNTRKNEETEPKQTQCPVLGVTADASKVRCCKEQYCIGTWNVRSMNQDKLKVVKQEVATVNIDILGISELKWTRTGNLI